ncbi:ThiN [Desulfamplus magnetovallimortis]|uniref:Thiamine diphosphokinase n=1 Tax=Desulfamplus magnetovallimortis TaxID=1246637 RepID=A0A1W1HKQ7_9BACT|nr:thiamine diphosphokinase [Desulfamplus magnetovallimortis]SLM33064.1 ThiN [Desulfamplus magnetovallimortis]
MDKILKCAIIANGIINNDVKLMNIVKEADIVVCADGGAKHLVRLGLFPDILMGDFDSIDKTILENCIKNRVELIQYPTSKDFSDTELSVMWAIDHGASEIILTGVTGQRMDHTLSNVFLLKKILKNGIKGYIVDDNNEIYLLSKRCFSYAPEISKDICIKGKPGDLLSIIPLSETVTGITLKGLKYPIENACMEMGTSKGISNVFTEKNAMISIKEGSVLITKSID